MRVQLFGVALLISASAGLAEKGEIEQRVRLFDRNEDKKADRRVVQYYKKDVLVRQVDTDDINFDGNFDSKIDTFYQDEKVASTFWHNLVTGIRGRIYWLNGKQVMIEIDQDKDEQYELRMFLDPETAFPVQVFEVKGVDGARPVTPEEFEEFKKVFLRRRPLFDRAIKEYSKRHLEEAETEEKKSVPKKKTEKAQSENSR